MAWRNPETMSDVHPSIKSRFAEWVFDRFNRKYGLEISESGARHMAEANRRLAHGPLIVYSNHISFGDLKLVAPLILTMPNTRRVMGPAGMKHYDFSRDPIHAAELRTLRIFGVHAVPVVQEGDVYEYSREQMKGMIINLRAFTEKLLNQPGTVYGIAPEGTRNAEGILQRGKRGVGMLETFMTAPDMQLNYLPVGLVYREQDAEHPRMVVSAPFTLNELLPDQAAGTLNTMAVKHRSQLITDTLMTVLAQSLPEHMRGEYADASPWLEPLHMTADQLNRT